jgi:hypothetical protein
MLKKWITSGDCEHARICDGEDCQGTVYHGGTGLLFDYMLSLEEDQRDAHPEMYIANKPLVFSNQNYGYMNEHKGSILASKQPLINNKNQETNLFKPLLKNSK